MKKITLIVLFWILILNLVNVISIFILFDKTSYELPPGITLGIRHILVPWLNFDGRNYLQIVNQGYDLGYITELRVFLPLYPLLIRLISLNTFFNQVVVGLVISFLCFVGAIFIFNKLLVNDHITKNDRENIILFILLFPASFYFLAYYTESLFFLLVVVTFYFLNKKEYFFASVMASLATVTRITGLALLPVLFYQSYKEYQINKKINWSILISPLGFIFYLLYIQIISGDFSAVITKQKEWNKPVGLLGPWYAIKDGFIKFLYGSNITHNNFFGRSMEIFEFIFAISLILIIIFSYKKIKFQYWLYLFFSSIPIFFSGVLSSVHRYMVVMFPIYIYLAKIIPKKLLLYVYFILFTILIYLSALFFRNYWVA